MYIWCFDFYMSWEISFLACLFVVLYASYILIDTSFFRYLEIISFDFVKIIFCALTWVVFSSSSSSSLLSKFVVHRFGLCIISPIYGIFCAIIFLEFCFILRFNIFFDDWSLSLTLSSKLEILPYLLCFCLTTLGFYFILFFSIVIYFLY